MNLKNIPVPRAGPFRRGAWDGTRLVVAHRPWFTAVVCWVLAGFCGVLLVATAWFPKSGLALEPEQARFIAWTAAGFAVTGGLVALWRRVWVIDPVARSICFTSGIVSGRGRVVEAPDGVWMAVHPIDVRVRGNMGWAGFAVVAHAGETEGVVCAMAETAAQADVEAKRLAEVMRVNVGVTGTERLEARV